MRGWRTGGFAWIVVVTAVAVIVTLAGCSRSTASQPPGPTGLDGADESAQPPGPTPEETGPIERDLDAAPPLILDPNGPGNDDAYRALIDEAAARVPAEVGEVPWPDLRNPDPAVAYRSCADFQNWLAENQPDPTLVDVYAAPGSPEWKWDYELFSDMQSLGVKSTPEAPPYRMDIKEVVDPAATMISDELLAEVPDGSAAVVYYDSVGASRYIDDDGNVLQERPGWTNVGPWVAIMEPTDAGWRVWWDELTDPPPGDRLDSGPNARLDRPPEV